MSWMPNQKRHPDVGSAARHRYAWVRNSACCCSETPSGFFPAHMPVSHEPGSVEWVPQPSSVIQIGLPPSPCRAITACTSR